MIRLYIERNKFFSYNLQIGLPSFQDRPIERGSHRIKTDGFLDVSQGLGKELSGAVNAIRQNLMSFTISFLSDRQAG